MTQYKVTPKLRFKLKETEMFIEIYFSDNYEGKYESLKMLCFKERLFFTKNKNIWFVDR